MLIGWRELADLCEALADKAGWDDLPSESALAACWGEARDLAGSNPSLEEEVAAIFHALSRNATCLGDAAVQLPTLGAFHQASVNDLTLVDVSTEPLRRLQNEVDDGLEFSSTVAWFEAHSRRLEPLVEALRNNPDIVRRRFS